MKDSYFFSTKKIVNLDESTIGYSGGKIVVKNKYSGETEFEHDLADAALGIRAYNGFIECGEAQFSYSFVQHKVDPPIELVFSGSVHGRRFAVIRNREKAYRIDLATGPVVLGIIDSAIILACNTGSLQYNSEPEGDS